MHSKTCKIFDRRLVSLLCALLTAVFILAGGACQNNNAERKLVATVNGDKIYLDEFQKELKIRKTRLGADTTRKVIVTYYVLGRAFSAEYEM